ncbi:MULTISPECIES: hypothetical protein [Anaerolinea]|uniref:RCC1 domain-containing protein n=1 Tax=Anaerolinea TaxID=233189 RepID=UPI002626ED27|nr:hypothetical protein [Anaerolinea thermophila]
MKKNLFFVMGLLFLLISAFAPYGEVARLGNEQSEARGKEAVFSALEESRDALRLGEGISARRLLTFEPLEGVTAIAVGYSHTCGLTDSGGVLCWGNNEYGQLGNGMNEDRATPVAVSGLSGGVTAITAGYSHTCALTDSGGVLCWGNNEYGQLGDGTTLGRLTPVGVSGLSSGVIAIAAGGYHTCALKNSGGVVCWGDNWNGQLGDGTKEDRLTPVAVSGLSGGVTAIAAGYSHSCAQKNSGGVVCWGSNAFGQLGDGTTLERLTPVGVSGLSSGVVAITAGYGLTCALTNSGGMLCWGDNRYGQLGDGTTSGRLTPVAVSGLSGGVIAIAAGDGHTCGLTDSGGVLCWGNNWNGQLGDGTRENRLTPVGVSGLTGGVIAIAAGGSHACALTNSGGVLCWGKNWNGQLGGGALGYRVFPVAVSGLSGGVTAITAGYSHTCGLTDSGGVLCWGDNWNGQLGDGTREDRRTPVGVSGLSSGVVAIAAGRYHTCALTNSGGVLCWGDNRYGQLGDGTTLGRLTPVAVSGLSSGVTAITAGYSHTCALTDSGGVLCWGTNLYGQLGDGTTLGRLTPVAVSGLSGGVVAISAGWDHTCAKTDNGGMLCWGSNRFGQLGDGTWEDRRTPVAVSGLSTGVRSIAAGGYHTCALKNSGGVVCWGSNRYGQLGDGTWEDRLTPVAVSGLSTGVIGIAVGQNHTCALKNSGGTVCWGDNRYGQLGDGTREERLTPVAVSGLSSGVRAVAAGGDHTCALTDNGGVLCWGDNRYGQLGDGTSGYSSVPAPVVIYPFKVFLPAVRK